MAKNASISVYSNFGVLENGLWYRKLVNQCFRVQFISKKRKSASFVFSSTFSVIKKYSREDIEHLQVAPPTQGKMQPSF